MLSITRFKDLQLCPVVHLELYLQQTYWSWQKGNADGNKQVLNSLFITCMSPFRVARGDMRAACTTKLANCRFTLTELLAMGRWAQHSDFYKYYLKSVASQKKAKNTADFIAVDKA